LTTILSTQKTNRAPLKSAIKMVVNSDIVGLDLETTGRDPRKDRIRLVQVSDGIKTYVIDAFKVKPAVTDRGAGRLSRRGDNARRVFRVGLYI
jgi:hypothetical protein